MPGSVQLLVMLASWRLFMKINKSVSACIKMHLEVTNIAYVERESLNIKKHPGATPLRAHILACLLMGFQGLSTGFL